MNKPDVYAHMKSIRVWRDQIRIYLIDMLRGTTEEQPFKCLLQYGDWCAVGLSSLELPCVTAMHLDEHDGVWLQCDSSAWVPLEEFCIEDLVELIEQLD